MKFVCNKCENETPCILVDKEDPVVEKPYSCPYSGAINNADWEEVDGKIHTAEPIPAGQTIVAKRGKILLKALDIINGERQDTYGKPEDSFKLIGEYWSNYLIANGWGSCDRLSITPREVAEMMMLFKIARMSGQKPNLDNYLDLVGYAGIASDMLEEK